MITRNGRDGPRPSWLPNRPTRAWPMPIANPAAVAMGKDRKSPTNAAASAARMRVVITVTCSVMMGTTRIPATVAIAEPSAQFISAIRLGDNPIAAADRSLSETASVARPNWLDR